MYKNILIAVDGSELSTKAAQHGAELASKLGAGLTLFHVVPLPSFDNMSPDRVETSTRTSSTNSSSKAGNFEPYGRKAGRVRPERLHRHHCGTPCRRNL